MDALVDAAALRKNITGVGRQLLSQGESGVISKAAMRKKKNKESATRSRERRKRKFEALERRAEELASENVYLKARVAQLESNMKHGVVRRFNPAAALPLALRSASKTPSPTASADIDAVLPPMPAIGGLVSTRVGFSDSAAEARATVRTRTTNENENDDDDDGTTENEEERPTKRFKIRHKQGMQNEASFEDDDTSTDEEEVQRCSSSGSEEDDLTKCFSSGERSDASVDESAAAFAADMAWVMQTTTSSSLSRDDPGAETDDVLSFLDDVLGSSAGEEDGSYRGDTFEW